MGNKLRYFFDDINALSHQCVVGERNNTPCGGLEAYQKESYPDLFLVVKMGKIFETFWRASIHYLINAWLEKVRKVT